MNWDLSRLNSLDPETPEFEAERQRLIKAEIEKVPLERRGKLFLFQEKLDQYRAQHGATKFLEHIVEQLRENVENLEDTLQYLKNTRAKTP